MSVAWGSVGVFDVCLCVIEEFLFPPAAIVIPPVQCVPGLTGS